MTERNRGRAWVSRERGPGRIGDTELQALKTWGHDPQSEMGGPLFTPLGSCSLVLACFLQWPWGIQIRGGGLPCNFWEGLCGCVRLGPCWTPALVAEPQLGTAPQGLAAGPASRKKPYKQGAVL